MTEVYKSFVTEKMLSIHYFFNVPLHFLARLSLLKS